MKLKEWLRSVTDGFLSFSDEGPAPKRYQLLRRKIVILMIFVTVVPLFFMAFINYHQYKTSLSSEIKNPLYLQADRTKHTIEIFLEERLAALRFINSAYPFDELSDAKTLNRIFLTLKRELGGFVDLGMIDRNGIQVSYAGPYNLRGKNYSEQSWFQETMIRGVYISDVFLGYRKYPHIALAVKKQTGDAICCIIRATIDTIKFDEIIASMGLDPQSDAFLINHQGILQTRSKFYGNVLETFPIELHRSGIGTHVFETTDHQKREIIVASSHFEQADYELVLIKPRAEVLKSWYTLKNEIFFIFVISVGVIILIILTLSGILVKRISEADEKRESTFRELQHSQKLSSIGRLAAGVAHEINNPLATINESAGLLQDLIDYSGEFQKRTKFLELSDSIIQSVERCRKVTHRLLGFARRLEVMYDELDLNRVVQDVLGFLETEALNRNIEIKLQFADNLPFIFSDHGQLQQVFLNILTNAFDAVKDYGRISINTWSEDSDSVAVSVEDNGAGMSKETLKHIFDPFFTTKKEYGTGLGLSITYGIVKKIGGDLVAQSEEGKGTIFKVYLPLKAPQDNGREV
jgi:two-component system NtrC family sensor kinase